MAYVYFAIGLAIFILSVFCAFKNRNDTRKWIGCITTGIFFSTIFMGLPMKWIKGETTYEKLYTVISSLFYSFKVLAGRQDIAQAETVSLEGIVKAVYIGINYVIFVLAPILASSLILSFFGDMGEKMRYFFRFSSKCYVFSEINENSIALARSVKNERGRITIIFCSAKNGDEALVPQAKKSGAILLYNSCKDIKIYRRFRQYEFFLLSENEDRNIVLAEALIARGDRIKKHKIIINAFVESRTNVKFLESIVNPGKSEKSGNGEKQTIELRCIDEIALFCNYLIYNYPLYHTKNHGKTISVAIVGCGRTGMRMLKTAYWAGQIDGYTLKIRVYDKAADKISKDFYKQCPGLKEEETIKFITADVDTSGFEEKLLEKENSPDATYIVIAMRDDQLNFSVADELYRIYRRSNGFDDERMPEIFARVRSGLKSYALFGNAEFLTKRHIHLFGTAESVYSHKTLFNTEFENLAFAVHLAYCKRLDKEKGDEEYEAAALQFKTSEYARRSSMASALHIPAKIQMCIGGEDSNEDILANENVNLYESKMTKKEEVERLARNEHDRWNAFMLSEGYRPATIEEMLCYSEKTEEYKDEDSMLHPCITDWDALDEVQACIKNVYGKDKKYKEYDRDIVRCIPAIIRKAKKMNGDN